MRDIFRHFHGDVHVFAVCQPSVPVLAATALMEADGEPGVPLTLTLAGGPIDTRVNPTVVNRLAEERGTEWFRRNVISTVPWPNPGAGRAVYPGFLQLTGFMTMNLDRHLDAHKDLFFHLVRGDGDSAEKHRDFYDEYLAVMDLTAEFFLQTVDQVFVNHLLPRRMMMHRGRLIDLGAIKRTALLTIEGEKDDITGVGQCAAAIELCSGIPDSRKSHYVCPDVGHYGIFNGSRFRRLIAPHIAAFARAHDPRQTATNLVFPRLKLAMMRGSAPLIGSLNAGRHDASAFTFDNGGDVSHAAANAAHPMREEGEEHKMSSSSLASLIPFKIWRFAGSLFLDSLSGLNPALGARRHAG
jgi:poly(3-hydroxybutyrate) depolymerase